MPQKYEKKSEENFTLFVAERKGFEPPVLERVQRFSRPPHSTTLASLLRVAEKEGFEPPEPSRVQRFSRPPHSTTLPFLRAVQKYYKLNSRQIYFRIFLSSYNDFIFNSLGCMNLFFDKHCNEKTSASERQKHHFTQQ